MNNIISTSILSKISENNNEYRNHLKELNDKVSIISNGFIGNLVTSSNYAIDFSNAISYAKENLIESICKIFESYVIKDLRSVEEVNEQFIDKINVKLEGADLSSTEDKENFIGNLATLLNDKYIEIIKIKRKEFFDLENSNTIVNETIENYVNSIIYGKNINIDILNTDIDNFKNELYSEIKKTFDIINDLYLNNFKNEIIRELSSKIDGDISKDITNNNLNLEEEKNETLTTTLDTNIADFNVPNIPDYNYLKETNEDNHNNTDVIPDTSDMIDESSVIEVPPIDLNLPMVDNEKEKEKEKQDEKTKTYDVDEILKIAKSPILNINDESNYIQSNYNKQSEDEIVNLEFNEDEIVEELINRLSERLKKIKDRKDIYDEQLKNVEEDEKFVDGLVESSNDKKRQLDNLEESLDALEKDLNKKQQELETKINSIMPFANAVLENQKES